MDSPQALSEQQMAAIRDERHRQQIAWMNALNEGSEAAFLALYREFSGQMLAVCLKILRDRHTAEDVLSEVFWEIWRAPQRYDSSRSSPQTYLLMVARSRAIDRLREIGRRARVHANATTAGDVGAMISSKDMPEAQVDRQEDGRLLRSALEGLDAPQRQVLELAFFGGMSHQQIANRLDHPLGTVKSRIRQGLIRLRSKLSASFQDQYRP